MKRWFSEIKMQKKWSMNFKGSPMWSVKKTSNLPRKKWPLTKWTKNKLKSSENRKTWLEMMSASLLRKRLEKLNSKNKRKNFRLCKRERPTLHSFRSKSSKDGLKNQCRKNKISPKIENSVLTLSKLLINETILAKKRNRGLLIFRKKWIDSKTGTSKTSSTLKFKRNFMISSVKFITKNKELKRKLIKKLLIIGLKRGRRCES